MLRRWNLEPLILDQLVRLSSRSSRSTRAKTFFAVVLATPDDEAHAKGKPDEKRFRVRQNVILELGLLLAMLGRPRVAILVKDQENTERPSDIQGLIYIPFKDDVEDAKVVLAKEMNAQGLRIDPRKAVRISHAPARPGRGTGAGPEVCRRRARSRSSPERQGSGERDSPVGGSAAHSSGRRRSR